MSKVGGGTATYFGNLRPRGARISKVEVKPTGLSL